MNIPLNIAKKLIEKVESELKKNHQNILELTQQEFLEILANEINAKLNTSLKSSMLYKKIWLPINKNEKYVSINATYKNALIQYSSFTEFEELMQNHSEESKGSTPIFYTGYTYEESFKIHRFIFIINPSNHDNGVVRLISERNDYLGELERRPNNLFIELTNNNDDIKSNVILFIGARYSEKDPAELLLGVYTQISKEGKPYASRAAFIRNEKVESLEKLLEISNPAIISEFGKDKVELDKIPIGVKRYIFSRRENVIEANESETFKISDLDTYAQQAQSISLHAGYYKMYFPTEEEENKLMISRIQILPTTGRVFYRGSTTRWTGYADKKGGNLYIELKSLEDKDSRAYIMLFVGAKPTTNNYIRKDNEENNTDNETNKTKNTKKIIYKGIFISINDAYKPYSGRVVAVFQHNDNMSKSLFDKEDSENFPTRLVSKNEIESEDENEIGIFDYLSNIEENELNIGSVKYFDKRDFQINKNKEKASTLRE